MEILFLPFVILYIIGWLILKAAMLLQQFNDWYMKKLIELIFGKDGK